MLFVFNRLWGFRPHWESHAAHRQANPDAAVDHHPGHVAWRLANQSVLADVMMALHHHLVSSSFLLFRTKKVKEQKNKIKTKQHVGMF